MLRALFALSWLTVLASGCPAPRDKAANETAVEHSDERVDRDGDGASFPEDCDDTDGAVHPGATERCNDRDDDCDGLTDEDPADPASWHQDSDSDGYGDDINVFVACDAPAGTSELGGDCDDTDGAVHPGATERCNDRDDDCDGLADEDAVDGVPVFADEDGDGFGDPERSGVACPEDEAWATNDDDCDDTNALVSPDAQERCNRLDDDCDGVTDEQEVDDLTTLCDLWSDHSLGDADVKVVGHVAGLGIGSAVGIAGDLDGDGHQDVVIGAEEADITGTDAGRVFVLPGPLLTSGSAVDLAVATIEGTLDHAQAGSRVSRAGDVDLDGYDDLWIGAPNDPEGGAEGSATLFLGPVAGGLALTDADLRWYGTANTNSVPNIDGSADYDADGVPELLASSGSADSGLGFYAGAVWVGRWTGAELERPLDEAELIVVADSAEDRLGYRAVFAGDTTGDSTEDLAFTGLGEGSARTAGIVWVVEDTLVDGLYTVTDVLDARLEGEQPADESGHELARLGDVNGDGLDDLGVGSPAESSAFDAGGAVYILYGPTAGRSGLGEADVKLAGTREDEHAMRIAGGGDVDGDGFADLAVAGVTYSVDHDEAERVYLLRGPIEPGTRSLAEADAIFTEEEVAPRAAVGESMSLRGDANGDGLDDLLIGAPAWSDPLDAEAESVGAVYLYLGQP